MSDNSIVLKDGERSVVISHKGRDFKFYFPADVKHITPIYEGDEVVCACMYGIIYPAGLLTRRAADGRKATQNKPSLLSRLLGKSAHR